MSEVSRRGFLGMLAAIGSRRLLPAPVATLCLPTPETSYSVTFTNGAPPDATYRIRVIGPFVIGQWADYCNKQWDCGNGFLKTEIEEEA